MSLEKIESELLDAGLHEESVNRLIEHYEDMRFYLGNQEYVEAGVHVGNFCENLANIILDETDQGAQSHVNLGNFVDDIVCGKYDTSDIAGELRLTIPRALRAAYDIRNDRDSVHVNLKTPVGHSDTQAAVRLCSWMLAELVRIYGNEDHIDEVAAWIEELATPQTPYIDSHEGKRIIMSRELSTNEEILVHLYALGSAADAETLTDWIPGADSQDVGGSLGSLKQARKVHYEDGTAKITSLGVEEAEKLVAEHFDDDLETMSRRAEQRT